MIENTQIRPYLLLVPKHLIAKEISRSSQSTANGVRHTQKINSYTKNLTKKAWFVTQSNIFYLKKMV